MPERHPTQRGDVLALFGKYLPRESIVVDLVARPLGSAVHTSWPAGKCELSASSGHRVIDALQLLRLQVKVLVGARPAPDVVVVRDMPTLAALAWFICRLRGVAFAYWMSFPVTLGYRLLADKGWAAIGFARWCTAFCRSRLGHLLLYRWVLRRAAHVFVQSEAMRDAVAAEGIEKQRMTAVPMGVDIEALSTSVPMLPSDPMLDDREAAVYVGTLGAARRLDVMIEAFALAWHQRPTLLLVVVGQEAVAGEEAELKKLAQRLGIAEQILWAGWRPAPQALGYMRRAVFGLSLIPRGPLFDVSSPTKLVEYLAVGLPAIASDIPDQALLAERSAAVAIVPMQPDKIAQAMLSLAGDPVVRARMSASGPAYVARERSYALLAKLVAKRLRSLVGSGETPRG